MPAEVIGPEKGSQLEWCMLKCSQIDSINDNIFMTLLDWEAGDRSHGS